MTTSDTDKPGDTEKPGQTPPSADAGAPPAGQPPANPPPANPPKPPDPLAKWKRYGRMAIAFGLFAASLPLPFPLGTITSVIGLTMLARDSKTARVLIAKTRRRWPDKSATFFRLGAKIMPRMIGELEESTNPEKVLDGKPPRPKMAQIVGMLTGRKDDAIRPPDTTRFRAFPVRPREESRLAAPVEPAAEADAPPRAPRLSWRFNPPRLPRL